MKNIYLQQVKQYKEYLIQEEKSQATIDKYIRDITKFCCWLKEETITKEALLLFKQELMETYQISSINSMLVAINEFLKYIGSGNCKVKLLKQQRRIFSQENKELTKGEYQRLLKAAKNRKNERLYMLMQTICATGIRVSEVSFIKVDAVKKGRVVIHNKGKVREVLFPKELRKLLLAYCRKQKIEKGCIFITRSGKAMNRSNIWKSMKELCKEAKVDQSKVFPHNLRHLFAFTFYSIEKDLVRLADILGHSTIETTRIYTMSSGKECELALSRLGLLSEY